MEWTRGHTIGRGSTASVSLATTTTTGQIFAVKSTELAYSSSLQNEQHLITRLSSPYIIKCLGSDTTCENDKHIFNLFLEYVPGGTLSDLIKKHGKSSLDETSIRFYAYQMLKGLSYLHTNGLVHCDIKGQNMLLDGDKLKIADFGCAKLNKQDGSFAGTPAYMAPEVARGEEQSFPADIWALGCTVIEMATGCNPWPEMKEPASALYRIGYSGDVPECPIWFSDSGKDFLSKCFVRDSKKRWTADELLQHEFFMTFGDQVNDCGEIVREFTRISPTSVIDQGFWDAMEVTSSNQGSEDVSVSYTDDVEGRIRGLVGEFSSFSDWVEEEDWVTVRGNEVEECSNVRLYGDDVDEDYEGFDMFSSIDDEEIQTSVHGIEEDSLFSNSFDNDVISFNENSNFPVISSEDGIAKDDIVSELFIFTIMEMQLSYHSSPLFIHSFSLFLFLPSCNILPLFNLKFSYKNKLDPFDCFEYKFEKSVKRYFCRH